MLLGRLAILLVVAVGATAQGQNFQKAVARSVYEFPIKLADSDQDLDWSLYKGKVVLFVNMACLCGYTQRDYEQLVRMDAEIDDLEIIGLPCNQFGAQEPWEEKEILRWTEEEFGRKFALTRKLDVNGEHTHPLVQYLKDKTEDRDVGWNFEKWLVGRDGVPRKAYLTSTAAEDIVPDIQALLGQAA